MTALSKKYFPFLFFTLVASSFKQEYFVDSGYVLLIILAITSFVFLKTHYSWQFASLISYLFMTAGLSFLSVELHIRSYVGANYMALFLTVILLSTVIFTHLTKEFPIDGALKWLGFTNACLAIFNIGGGGFLANQSVSQSFTAIVSPYMPLWMLPVAAFSFFNAAYMSSAALAIVLFQAVAHFAKISRSKTICIAGGALFLVGTFLIFKHSHHAGNDPTRFETWKAILQFWWETGNRFVGYGIGTMTVLGPKIQPLFDGQTLFTTVHNDWIQLLFERGVIGFSLFMLVIADCLIKSWKIDLREFSLHAGFCIFATFFFALEVPTLLFLWIFLIQRRSANGASAKCRAPQHRPALHLLQ